MMTDASGLIIQIMPLAWGAAVSPVVLSIFLVIMSISDKPRLSGLSFYLGAIIVLLLVLLMGMLLGNSLSSVGAADPKTTAAIDMVVGVILLILAFRNFAIKEQEHKGGIFKYLKPGKDSTGIVVFGQFFVLGLVSFLTNITTAVFVLAAGKDIALSSAGPGEVTLAIIILTVITLLVVEVPLAIFLIMPHTAHKITKPLNQWISNNGNYVTGLFVLVIGIYITFKGAKALGLV
jgi:threonine/homoserine/homoserine lactone efflux protein